MDQNDQNDQNTPPSGPATGGSVPPVAPSADVAPSPPAPGPQPVAGPPPAAPGSASATVPAPTSGTDASGAGTSGAAAPAGPYATVRASGGGGGTGRKGRRPAPTLRDRIVARLLAASRGAAERAADALLDGTFKGEQHVGSYSAPITRITDGTRITSEAGVNALIPAPGKGGKGGAGTAPNARAQQVLELRRQGRQRHEIAKAMGITSRAVLQVLQRHGDPAPATTHAAERVARERAEASSLKVAARKLGLTVDQLLAMRPKQ